MTTPSSQLNVSINAPQALFGTLFGVWYGGITRDVLSSNSVTLPLPMTLDQVKTLYVISSLTLITWFVIYMIRYQQELIDFLGIFRHKTNIRECLGAFWKIIVAFLFSLLMIIGHLFLTQSLFADKVSSHWVLFGILQALIWLALSAYLCWRADLQKERPAAGEHASPRRARTA